MPPDWKDDELEKRRDNKENERARRIERFKKMERDPKFAFDESKVGSVYELLWFSPKYEGKVGSCQDWPTESLQNSRAKFVYLNSRITYRPSPESQEVSSSSRYLENDADEGVESDEDESLSEYFNLRSCSNRSLSEVVEFGGVVNSCSPNEEAEDQIETEIVEMSPHDHEILSTSTAAAAQTESEAEVTLEGAECSIHYAVALEDDPWWPETLGPVDRDQLVVDDEEAANRWLIELLK